MTTQAEHHAATLRAPTYEELTERFRPVFDRIAERAVERETARRLPFEEVEWLRSAGFGALRVPVELGGSGVTLTQLVALLVDLGAAESNLPQALRPQFAFVEGLLADPGSDRSRRWLAAAVRGVLVGNATSERGTNVRGIASTTLSERDGRLLLNGTKYYSTGSLFANHLSVAAQRADTGERISVLVAAEAPGVERHDDFAGVGQRLTASGTTVFTDVEVDPAEIGPAGTLAGYRAAFVQLVLLAALAGIARRAADDVADYVRRRTRTWGHGNADLPRADPLVQQVVGRVDSAAHAARATVLAAASALERSGPHDRDPAAEVDVYRAQVTVTDLVLRATSELFEVGGASAVDDERKLDRHWRNARTIAVHNPVIYKQRIVGEHLLDGTLPTFTPSVGIAPSPVEQQR
jgi:alkylation response protein AidB-like acyl-CoA dehydrogenase